MKWLAPRPRPCVSSDGSLVDPSESPLFHVAGESDGSSLGELVAAETEEERALLAAQSARIRGLIAAYPRFTRGAIERSHELLSYRSPAPSRPGGGGGNRTSVQGLRVQWIRGRVYAMPAPPEEEQSILAHPCAPSGTSVSHRGRRHAHS